MIFLLRYWKEGLIVALAALLALAWRDHNRTLEAKGRAEERSRVADSTLAVLAKQAPKVDTVFVHDSVRYAVLRERVAHDTAWRHDTTYLASDTAHHDPRIAIPVATLIRRDSLERACSAVVADCEAQKVLLRQQRDAWKAKAEAAPTISVRSCAPSNVVWGALGAAVGAIASRKF